MKILNFFNNKATPGNKSQLSQFKMVSLNWFQIEKLVPMPKVKTLWYNSTESLIDQTVSPDVISNKESTLLLNRSITSKKKDQELKSNKTTISLPQSKKMSHYSIKIYGTPASQMIKLDLENNSNLQKKEENLKDISNFSVASNISMEPNCQAIFGFSKDSVDSSILNTSYCLMLVLSLTLTVS